MGRIKELINKFIQPSETSKTFDELAIVAGIKPGALEELKETQNGVVGWPWHSEEPETDTKNRRESGLGRITSSRDTQPKQPRQSTKPKIVDNDLTR